MDVDERLSLEAMTAETLIASEHIHRYELAAALCRGATVLDLCCGSGYGASVLSQSAERVLGIDRDAASVDAASASLASPPSLTFEVADAVEYLERPEVSDFDVIVCFEGLEHLERLDEALSSLERLAKRGARLILSVPNSATLGEENRFHLKDFSLDEALAAFSRLGSATMLHQFLAEGSLIRGPDPAELDARTVLADRGEPRFANHFIGLINFEDGELAETSARMQLAVAPHANRHMRSLERANRELWRTNARLGRKALAEGQGIGEFATAAAARLVRLSSETTDAGEPLRQGLRRLLTRELARLRWRLQRARAR
jgi:2-polyprenyl-3-methyl-5-hydroxy-6-metoxy-1,4-benzoquinol methylase